MKERIVSGILLDDQAELSLSDLCHACSRRADWFIELVEEGVLTPIGGEYGQWRFSAVELQRARIAMHLETDLDINLSGIALVLDLLEEIDLLRARLNRMEPEVDS